MPAVQQAWKPVNVSGGKSGMFYYDEVSASDEALALFLFQ